MERCWKNGGGRDPCFFLCLLVYFNLFLIDFWGFLLRGMLQRCREDMEGLGDEQNWGTKESVGNYVIKKALLYT